MPPGWLGHIGDPVGPGVMGPRGYLAALVEDERVRDHWSRSCEGHRLAMQRHEKTREQIRPGPALR